MPRSESAVRRLARDARRLYRLAIAAEIAGLPSAALWLAWSHPVAGLLLAAAVLGRGKVLAIAKAPLPFPEEHGVGSLPMPVETPPEVIRVEGWDLEGQRRIADLFRRRVPMTKAQWIAYADAARARSLEMAGHESADAIRAMSDQSPRFRDMVFFAEGVPIDRAAGMRDLIADSIASGNPRSSDFIARSQVQLGIDLTDARLDMILRTNMATAQTAAERRAMREPGVRGFVPLMRWSAIHDQRTRPTHRAMDGYVGTVEDFERQHLGPPAAWNCRCSAIPLSLAYCVDSGFVRPDGSLDEAAIIAHNGARQTLIDSGQFPDPGFVG